MNPVLPTYHYLTTNAELASAASDWHQLPWAAVDTEFLRERTFKAIPGLIQIATPDQYLLIDPISITDFSPVIELFNNPNTVKILHSASEDLELFFHFLGNLPCPLFDTQIASAFLGQGLSLSYKNLVASFYPFELGKEEQRSDWTLRPLSPSQLDYAVQDVLFLGQIYLEQLEQLKSRNILSWMEEDCNRLLTNITVQEDYSLFYLKVKGAGTLDGHQLARLQKLAEWREVQARIENIPRGFIIKDPQLVSLVQRNPTDFQELRQIEGLHPKSLRRYGNIWIQLLQAVDPDHTLPILPNERLPKEAKPVIKALRLLLEQQAKLSGISPELFMNRKKLNAMAGYWLDHGELKPASFLSGWRLDVLSQPLIQLFAELKT